MSTDDCEVSEVNASRANPTLVTVLSIVMPGLGQLVNGQVGKGLGMLALDLVLLFVAWPLALLVCAWSAWDAYEEANQLNAQQELHAEIATQITAGQIATSDFVNQIEKLNNLAQAGMLSTEELASRKLMVINILKSKKPTDSIEDFLTALIPLVKSGGLSMDDLAQIKNLQA